MGLLSAIAMDMMDAQRGGVINAVVFLQIVPPARITRRTNVGAGRDHAGTGASSCSEPPSELDTGVSPRSEHGVIVDVYEV
jgi:hypothetical protein